MLYFSWLLACSSHAAVYFSYFEGILDQVEFYSRIELYRYDENIYLVPNLGNCS